VSDLVRSPGVTQFNHIADCLELFDSFLLGRWANDEHQLPLYYNVINGEGQDDLAEGLATLCAVCNIILRNSDYEDSISIGDLFDTCPFVWLTLSRLANRCLESALRVLINVSHENPTWCGLLLHQELMIPVISSLIASSLYGARDVTETGERDAQAFDRLCLALGLLTNLVQVDKNCKDLCRETSELLMCSSSIHYLKVYRTRSIMPNPPSVRVRVQLSERCQRSRVPCFRLRAAFPTPARGRRSWDSHYSRAPRGAVWPPHVWVLR
jgi:hypothetical protein